MKIWSNISLSLSRKIFLFLLLVYTTKKASQLQPFKLLLSYFNVPTWQNHLRDSKLQLTRKKSPIMAAMNTTQNSAPDRPLMMCENKVKTPTQGGVRIIIPDRGPVGWFSHQAAKKILEPQDI